MELIDMNKKQMIFELYKIHLSKYGKKHDSWEEWVNQQALRDAKQSYKYYEEEILDKL
jgi:hypothetical protein